MKVAIIQGSSQKDKNVLVESILTEVLKGKDYEVINFGWAAEINIKCILEKLFDEPFGVGYPKEEAKRKQKDTETLKYMNAITKRELKDVLPQMEIEFIKKVLSRDNVFNYVMKYGKNNELRNLLKSYL